MATQSILPHFRIFTPPEQPMSGIGKYGLLALSPVVAAVKGLGDDAPAPATDPTAPMMAPVMTPVPAKAADVAWTAIFLGVVAAVSYSAGKAMAPSREDRSTWGWIGVPVGLFGGVIGLGVMGAVSNGKKG